MQQPTRAESLRSLALALTCALIVLIAIYFAVDNSRLWADKDRSVENPAHGASIQIEPAEMVPFRVVTEVALVEAADLD